MSNDPEQIIVPCPECDGQGYEVDDETGAELDCWECGGGGEIEL